MVKAKRILLIVCCFALIFAMGGEVILSAFCVKAGAAEMGLDITQSNALQDLEGAIIEGVPFSTEAFNPIKGSRVLTLLEYGYGDASKFEIYIYFLLSFESVIVDNTLTSSATLAFEETDAASFSKYKLYFVNEAKDETHGGRYLKYRVDFTDGEREKVLSLLDKNNRCYKLGEFEFHYKYEDGSVANPMAVPCGFNYVYSGYMSGCGPASDPLSCTMNDKLETVSLNVTPTYYRMATSDKGTGYQKQLDSVFFSVPKRLMDQNGKLQRIKAEWYEYKTSPIIVTSHKEFYNTAKNWVGVYMGALNEYGNYPFNEDAGYGLALNPRGNSEVKKADWGWNLGEDYIYPACQRLAYLFYTDDIKTYDYTQKRPVEPDVYSCDLYDHIFSYYKSNSGKFVPAGSLRNVSADLFMNDIDDSRKISNDAGVIKQGYSFYDFDADADLHELKTWSTTNPSFWDNWAAWGFLSALTGGPDEQPRECAPIYIVTASDLVGTNEEVAERLMVKVDDVPSLWQEYNNAKTVSGSDDEEMEVVLFRFAVSDYFSKPVDIFDLDSWLIFEKETFISDQAYMSQGSCFLNFDIIQLTFRESGLDTVIPVAMAPIDIVPEITPPIVSDPAARMEELMEALLRLVGIVLLVVGLLFVWSFISPFIAPVLKLVWKGIKIIFKWIFKILFYPFKLLFGAFQRK